MASGEYDMIIYDYRDTNTLVQNTYDEEGNLISAEDTSKADSYMLKWSSVSMKFKEEVEIPETVKREYVEYEEAIRIQCSDQQRDYIPIRLPKIDLDTLGIRDYQVNGYTTKLIKDDEDYYKRHKEWEEDYTDNVTTETVVRDVPNYVTVFQNGEPQLIQKGTKQVTSTIYKHNIVHNGEEPQIDPSKRVYKTYYDPSDVSLIEDALKRVTDQRSYLGAIQNRLEHSYDNNQNKLENTTAAESRIRDTDMASEMVRFSNYNILQQAGQSMLTQANQSRDFILSLLG
ncbi:MAG: flagellin [Lachnospiraceae bacterium]|nr:flagellin [Lachnospiraceae bacterium]